MRVGNSVSYLLLDQLGSTSITVDGNGSKITSTLAMIPIGKIRSCSRVLGPSTAGARGAATAEAIRHSADLGKGGKEMDAKRRL